MKKLKLITIVLLLSALSACKKDEPDAPIVVIEDDDTIHTVYTLKTTKGDISLVLYKDIPAHYSNFDSLARAGYYDGVTFHRVIKDFMIQGGDPTGSGSGGPGYTLPSEIGTKYKHKHGALAAARLADAVNPDKRSSGSQFYIVENVNGVSDLDGNYTVFGETLVGLDVVSDIASVSTGAVKQNKPDVDVVINSVETKKYGLQALWDTFSYKPI